MTSRFPHVQILKIAPCRQIWTRNDNSWYPKMLLMLYSTPIVGVKKRPPTFFKVGEYFTLFLQTFAVFLSS